MLTFQRTLLAALLLAAFSTSLSAQVRDRDPALAGERTVAADLQTASLHHGAFYLRSSIQLSDLGYDQEFFSPTADQTTGVTLGVSAPQRLYFVPTKKVVFSADFVPSYSFVTSQRGHGQAGYFFRGDARLLLNHLYLDVFASGSNQLRANTGELNNIVTVRQTTAGTAGEYKYSSRTSVTFAGNYTKSSYPTSRVQPDPLFFPVILLNNTDTGGRGSLLHKTFPLTSLRLVVAADHYRFQNAPAKNSNKTFGGGGLSFDNGRTALSAEAGITTLNFLDPAQLDFHGPTGSMGLSRKLAPLWTANLGATRDLDFSIYETNNFYVLERATFGLTYSATRRLTLLFNSQEGRDIYFVPVNGILRRDTIVFNSVGWSYALRRLRGGFDVGYYNRKSNLVAGQKGIRFIVHLSLTL